jgi:LacI family transcriptional regulator
MIQTIDLDTLKAMANGWVIGLTSPTIEKIMDQLGVPIVNVSSRYEGTTHPSVLSDETGTGRLAAEHLLQCGYRQFGVYGNPLRYSELRQDGFQQAIEERGLPCRKLSENWGKSFPAQQFHEVNERDLFEWMRSFTDKAGILTDDQHHANRVYTACEKLKLRVPEDVGVVTCAFLNTTPPPTPIPTTCVMQDIELLGRTAMEWILKMVRGEPAPETPVLVPPHGLVQRSSTRPREIDDPRVIRALRHIEQHACDRQIRVEEVAAAAGMSLRSLHRRFKEATGTTVHHQLLQSRLEHAKKLLRETDAKLSEVAEQSGFRDEFQFSHAFRREVGMSPGKYRETKSQTRQEENALRKDEST